MLSRKEIAEISGASNSQLRAIVGVMGRQVGAPLFIGDRAKSAEVKEAAAAEIDKRERQDVMNYCIEGAGNIF